jgi:uncharacterized DUF497 family protein
MSAQDRLEDGEPRWRTSRAVEGQLVLPGAHSVAQGEDATVTEAIRLIFTRNAHSNEKRP